MCKFFSLVSDGKANVLYFNSEQRKKIIAGTMTDRNGNAITETDSHSSILAANGIFGVSEDLYNKYEYNPLTKLFEIDRINVIDDSAAVKQFCLTLDYKTIVPELIIKPIVNPFTLPVGKVTDREINLLKQWATVRASAGASAWASVGDSVADSVWGAVWDSVGDSVGDSVSGSARASVVNSVAAYMSSFYSLKKWEFVVHEDFINPFQPCINLWESGFVPSFDGKKWRLHAGAKVEIVYEAAL